MFFDHAVLDTAARGVLLSISGMIWIVALVRVVGLRSFSKMTNFDFVMTIAMGSLLASAATTQAWLNLVQIFAAMWALFGFQFVIAVLRQRSDGFETAMQNAPVLLMKDGKVIPGALRKTRVSEDDLIAKLREANALDMKNVRAVVLETTGDVSVLHGECLDPHLIAGIAGSE